MTLDYIEIGTSDFDTCLGTSDEYGMSIEPLVFYLENLPIKKNNIKLNVAISDKIGYENIYYVHPEDIHKYDLPFWVRGCSSLNQPHPSVSKILSENNLNHILRSESIETITWDKLIRDYQITHVKYLKIDTQDDDYIIINQILKSNTNILPDKILFEFNVFTDSKNIENTLMKLKLRGYKIIENNVKNVIVEYTKNIPKKIIFASDDSRYLKFWQDNSKICSEILQITPVLLHITDEDSDFYWDNYGLVKKIKFDGYKSIAAQTIRLFSGKFFPKENIMISDIDMFLFDRKFIENHLINCESYDITIIGSDAYKKERSECPDHIILADERFPMCYIVCEGQILNKIMDINGETNFEEFFNKNNFNYGWNSDEIIFSFNLLNTDLKINRVERNYRSDFYLSDRIEKYMFTESSSCNKINLKSINNLLGFVEFHSSDYDENIETIKHLLTLIYKQYE